MLSQYIATKGELGEMPWYVPLFEAAQECNCAPWELLEQSVFWQDAALKIRSAKASANETLKNRGH